MRGPRTPFEWRSPCWPAAPGGLRMRETVEDAATVAGRLRTNTGKSSSVHDSDHPSQRIIERFRSRRKEFDTIIVATYWNGKGVATEDFIDPL